MTQKRGSTTRKKPQVDKYSVENNQDIMRTRRDGLEFTKLLKQEKEKLKKK